MNCTKEGFDAAKNLVGVSLLGLPVTTGNAEVFNEHIFSVSTSRY